MVIKITDREYELMKAYIEQHCAIHLEAGKEYLIETRLSDLVLETGCTSFTEFHKKAMTDVGGKLRDRVVDAMTTNETLWFRDAAVWKYMEEVVVPELIDKVEAGQRPRVWSAAASTGQEAFSLVMLLKEEAQRRGKPMLANQVEILGTDISSSALFLAMSGRYDVLAIGRGLSAERKQKFFKQDGRVWVLQDDIKKAVKFKRFNLQEPFTAVGQFDIVLCRYVAIYFAPRFKEELFSKFARVLKSKGLLILGATETIRGFSDDFDIKVHKNCIYNQKKV